MDRGKEEKTMSHYVLCRRCGEQSLDVDSLSCDDCGYCPNQFAEDAKVLLHTWLNRLRHGEKKGTVDGIIFETVEEDTKRLLSQQGRNP